MFLVSTYNHRFYWVINRSNDGRPSYVHEPRDRSRVVGVVGVAVLQLFPGVMVSDVAISKRMPNVPKQVVWFGEGRLSINHPPNIHVHLPAVLNISKSDQELKTDMRKTLRLLSTPAVPTQVVP